MNRKYKINSSLMVVIVIAIVIAVNVFVTVLTGKFPIKLDMTPNQIYSISDSTKEYLKSYNQPTEIFIMAPESDEDNAVKTVLSNYAVENSNIKITNIDPATNPTFGKKYVTDDEDLGSVYVIVDGGEKFKTYTITELYNVSSQGSATSINVEGRITSALKYISSTAPVNAYIVNGHNEMAQTGIKEFLEDESYTVKDLNLTTEEIPEDASLLLIVSPATDFSVPETAKLDAYFAKGGHAQFYFDAAVSEGLTNLYDYLKKWGIQVNDNVAVEQGKSNTIAIGGGNGLIVSEIAEDDITNTIIENKRTIAYFPYAKTLTKLFDAGNNITVKPLLTTTSSAYATSNYENLEKQDTDETGVFNIGILASNSQNKSSIYVSGTSMLLNVTSDVLAANYGFANYDYFMNICSFMHGNTDDYTVSAKSLYMDTIEITLLAAVIIGIILAILIPIIVLVSGIVVWFKRRHM